MDITSEIAERLTRLVRTYCSVNNATGTVDPGRFFFAQGENTRKAKEARQPITFNPDFERTLALVFARVRDMLQDQQGDVWVRAFYEGANNPCESVRIPGSADELEQSVGVDDGSALGALVGGLVLTNRQLLAQNDQLFNKVAAQLQNEVNAAGLVSLLATREGIANVAERQAAAAAMADRFAPMLERALPIIFAKWGGGAAPAGPPTGTPPEQVGGWVDRIIAGVGGLSSVLQAHGQALESDPEARPVVEGHVERLRQLIEQIAPLVSMQTRRNAGAT